MNFHLTPLSKNSKTGHGVAVSTSDSSTCPDACPLKAKGCYAKTGPIALHWRKVDTQYGTPWDSFIDAVRALPIGWKFRHNQAGDLPGRGDAVNVPKLRQLTRAVADRKLVAWTYTHKPLTPRNVGEFKRSIAAGFVINVSADSLKEADAAYDTGLPTTVILPEDSPDTRFTPKGRKIVGCPAQTRDGITCATCQLCAVASRSVIVGFFAHGTHKKHVSAISA